MCISFAVMLPVGNPPNAIVFSYGHCQIKDMVSRRRLSRQARRPGQGDWLLKFIIL